MAANPFAEFAAQPTQAANPFAQFAAPQPEAQSEVPGPRKGNFFTGMGRGLASLADVTVGGVLPTIAQQVVYPVARALRTPEEATAITQGIVSAADRPFGKAFGVTGTPEYEQEASRRLMGFIGENFQKGANWISKQTGVPAADVENMMGSLTLAAPAAAKPVGQAVKQTVAPVVERAVVAAKMPFEKQIKARQERMSLEDYARGPQIDAAAEAQRLGIALNPVDIEPSRGAKATSMIAGARGPEALANVNKGQVRKVVLNELGLPETTQLNSPEAFKQARAQVAAPYDEVAKLPTMTADDTVRGALDRLRPDESMIGSDKYAAAVNSIVDDAMAKVEAGMTGDQLLKNVQTLRQRARKVYNNKNADLAALDVADTNLAVANALESMIESNIFDPKLLDRFRDARQKMARTYAYEGATDLNTGMVDVKKLSRITSKDNSLTGDIASLGQIAGNFPDVFSTKATSTWYSAPRLSRSGVAGGVGALVGSQFGLTGSILGGALGGALGEGAGALAARRMASPEYQAGLQLRDMRLPVNQLAAQQPPIPQDRAVVPYQQEVLGPSGEGAANRLRIVGYDENDLPIYAPSRQGAQQGFTMPPQPHFGAAPTPYAQRSLTNEIPRQTYEAQKRAELAQEYREAAANMGKRTTNRAMNLEWDPVAQVYREAAPQGAGGVVGGLTPLESAVQKMSGQVTPETTGTIYTTTRVAPKTGAEPYTRITRKGGETAFERQGQAFAMTAEEKIAWNKAKADLAEVMPGMKSLTDEAIAAKMMDRDFAAQAVANARAKAEQLALQEAKLAEQLANRNNLRLLAREIEAKNKQLAKIQEDRQNLMTFAEQMEEGLRAARPAKTGGQGPKTRAHQRNKLNMLSDQDVLNKLLEK